MNMSMKKDHDESLGKARHAGDLFEKFFIDMVKHHFDSDSRKITDKRAPFGDMSTPCRLTVELKSRKWLKSYTCLTQENFLYGNHFAQIQNGLEFASRTGSLYAFIVGVHKFADIDELLKLINDPHAFLKAHSEVYVLLGDCNGVTYRKYDIVNLLTNLNNESFRDKLIDGHLSEIRPFDVKVNLNIKLDPNRPEWDNENWVNYFKQNVPIQQPLAFPIQREFNFKELMYDSVMLEEETGQHQRHSTFESDLIKINLLNISDELKISLKQALKKNGLKTRVHILKPLEFFVAMTLLHFGVKFVKQTKVKLRVSSILKKHHIPLPANVWCHANDTRGTYKWLQRFHELLESNGLIHHYLLIDPATYEFRGLPSLNWSHEDHCKELLNALKVQPVAEVQPVMRMNTDRELSYVRQIAQLNDDVIFLKNVIDRRDDEIKFYQGWIKDYEKGIDEVCKIADRMYKTK